MDKATVRILFLTLIAVMFIGQAVYDFVKKNRSQASRHRPAPRPKTAQAIPEKLSVSPSPTVPSPLLPSSEKSDSLDTLTNIAPSPKPDSEPEPTTTSNPQSEELRRAIIWSEILKRKY